jgi:hypothetical protein
MGEKLLLDLLPSLRPIAKLPLGKTLLAKPKALPVIAQNLYRCCSPVAEHEHCAGERVRRQHLAACPSQAVYTPAEVNRLDRN